ncbi:MAG: hypothetical protein ACREJM_16275, partial [Candidatus Saccharimonadales bacterium]
AVSWAAVGVLAAEPAGAIKKDKPKYTTESHRGRVVWMAEALQERFNIQTDDDAAEALAALEDPDGRLHPLLKDQRGRCFYTDKRLRDIEVELLVRRYAGSPMLQVVRIYTIKSGDKYELDYWCDICSIPMYELKPCECCQGPTRLRERLVEKASQTDETEPRPKSPTKTK